MILFPAIDIRGGKCVRLEEGRFDRETVFAENPLDAARRWVEAGTLSRNPEPFSPQPPRSADVSSGQP